MREHVAVVVGRAVVVAHRNHRRRIAGNTQFNLRWLQSIVVINRMNETIAVAFSIQRIVSRVPDARDARRRCISRPITVQLT